jgi:hypothetical protein
MYYGLEITKVVVASMAKACVGSSRFGFELLALLMVCCAQALQLLAA